MSRDLDAMHYGRTGKNHDGAVSEPDTPEEEEVPAVGDPDLWEKLR